MGLRISLKPYERLIINGTSIKNGSRSTDFLIESRAKFLRESEIIHESEADTPCKNLCLTLQVIHLSDKNQDAELLFFRQSIEIMKIMPSSASFLLSIQEALADGETHKALKAARQLVYHERDLLADQASKGVDQGTGLMDPEVVSDSSEPTKPRHRVAC